MRHLTRRPVVWVAYLSILQDFLVSGIPGIPALCQRFLIVQPELDVFFAHKQGIFEIIPHWAAPLHFGGHAIQGVFHSRRK